MSGSNQQPGYFLFSLDTELSWGYFDRPRPATFSQNGQLERRTIEQLLDILDEFSLTATWAVVGHMFYQRCEDCEVCPVLSWKGRYATFEQVYGTADPRWYGADIIELILERGSRHEIAFHGFTHRVFDEHVLSEMDAHLEIQAWLRVASRRNIVPRTAIFPRGRVGHLKALKQAGIICYRGDQVMPGVYSIPLLGKALNRVDLVLQFFAPQVYDLEVEPSGLVNLPSSRWLFGMPRRVEQVLDALNLQKLRIRRIVDGVEQAAQQRKIVHVWAHPHEFRTNKDFEKLRYLFMHVSDQISRGKLRSVSMSELATMALERAVPGPAVRSASALPQAHRIAQETT